MKIGVLTYHCQPNFGAQLQAISTVGHLRRLGHEPIVLDWYAADLEEMYSKRIPEAQVRCHQEFTNASLPLSAKCSQEQQLIEEINRQQLDAILVGSDALFKYVPARNRRHFSKRKLRYIYDFTPLSCELLDGNPFFGAFLKQLAQPIPASVYAASSQNCPYGQLTCSERRQMASALSQYKYISVRDAWTKKMIHSVTGRKEVPIFPDPVFSFKQNCYLPIPSKEEILQRYGLHENYILFSFRNKFCPADYLTSLATAFKDKGFQPVALPMPEGLFAADIEKKIDIPLTPIDWYALIIYSKGYVGERMHPIVVCLHNAIPFFNFDEYGTKRPKSFFNKQLVYNPDSSKTRLIVAEARFVQNLYSYQGGTPFPTPDAVLHQIQHFDQQKCQLFSSAQTRKYEDAMAKVLASFR